MDESAEASNQEKIVSRRNFLKQSAATAVLGTATLAGINLLKSEQSKEDDKEAQKGFKTLGRLLQKLASNPSDETAKEQLESFLAFNLAAVYLRGSGSEISSKFALHFLYGEGRTLDISQQLVESFKVQVTLFESTEPDLGNIGHLILGSKKSLGTPIEIAIWEGAIINTSPESRGSMGPLYLMESEKRAAEILKGKTGNLTVACMVKPPQTDLRWSLGHFLLRIEGNVINVREIGSESDFASEDTYMHGIEPSQYPIELLTIQDPTVAVADVYDFAEDGKALQLQAKVTYFQALQQIGSMLAGKERANRLIDNLPKPFVQTLKEMNVSFAFNKAAKLLREAGIGKPFDVRGAFKLSQLGKSQNKQNNTLVVPVLARNFSVFPKDQKPSSRIAI